MDISSHHPSDLSAVRAHDDKALDALIERGVPQERVPIFDSSPADELDNADNTSVAGEEDPGAALEFTRPGRNSSPPRGVREVPCDR